jgi:transcription elongation factor Elf1
MFYAAVVRDVTEDCVNYGQSFEVPELYSNGGQATVTCGLCGQPMELDSATLLDPQPEM